jgi:hypothetical protein
MELKVLRISWLIKRLMIAMLVLSLSSCYSMTKRQMDKQYGEASHVERVTNNADVELYSQAQNIIEKRCVVCHACYDAPCQLKLTSLEGLDRGANKRKVYDGRRLLASAPSNFFEDSETQEDWRKQEFYPVLNEREQTPENNLTLSVIYQMLALKQENPLPDTSLLPNSFDLKLVRDQYCPKIEEFADFKEQHPLWGMPYGLPAIADEEFLVLKKWIEQGAKKPEKTQLSTELQSQVDFWEAFFNGESFKQKLVSRYLFEHLYLGDLYFSDIDTQSFFRIVRSYTPSGEPIKEMSFRRPYDQPAQETFFYRLQLVRGSIVAKTHMPYALNEKRYEFWKTIFYDVDYSVATLPSYDVAVSSNPFVVFEAIPVKSRYLFLLEEAQFSIMNFIKGPVCRGQIALSVINDHFWVVFANPESQALEKEEEFLKQNKELLRFPAYWESNGSPWSWIDLAKRQENYIQAKSDFMNRSYSENLPISLDVVWTGGEAANPNAALTIFRHFDSATVVKGFAGSSPQSAWLIDYPLLERIHYLLVAGFDVNGNVLHQLLTRLSMDFLRMEGEANFLALLPKAERRKVQNEWYSGAEEEVQDFFGVLLDSFTAESSVPYVSTNPKEELLEQLMRVTRAREYGIAVDEKIDIDITPLVNLNGSEGIHISYLPQTSIVEVRSENQSYWFSFLHHNVHQNKTRLLTEDTIRTPEKDKVLITEGIISAYPNALFSVNAELLPQFVHAIQGMSTEKDYQHLVTIFGIRRTNKNFWAFSDKLHQYYQASAGLEYGLLDYNRLENR